MLFIFVFLVFVTIMFLIPIAKCCKRVVLTENMMIFK